MRALADHAAYLLATGAARGVEGRYDEALALLAEAASALGAPASDPLALQIALARVEPLRLTGRLTEATATAREVSRLAELGAEARLAGVAAVALGFCLAQATEYEAALELALRGRGLARAAGDGPTEASAAYLIAFAAVARGVESHASPSFLVAPHARFARLAAAEGRSPLLGSVPSTTPERLLPLRLGPVRRPARDTLVEDNARRLGHTGNS